MSTECTDCGAQISNSEPRWCGGCYIAHAARAALKAGMTEESAREYANKLTSAPSPTPPPAGDATEPWHPADDAELGYAELGEYARPSAQPAAPAAICEDERQSYQNVLRELALKLGCEHFGELSAALDAERRARGELEDAVLAWYVGRTRAGHFALQDRAEELRRIRAARTAQDGAAAGREGRGDG